jgi:hypothetical protein
MHKRHALKLSDALIMPAEQLRDVALGLQALSAERQMLARGSPAPEHTYPVNRVDLEARNGQFGDWK